MQVWFLQWDEENEEHLSRHGISPREARELLSNRHITMPNPEREGRYFLIGETNGGTVLTLSIDPTWDDGTWRPVTGWPAGVEERKLFERHVR